LDKEFDPSFNIPELSSRPIDVLLDSLPSPNSPFIYKQPKDSQNSYINDDEIQSSISTQISESTYSVSEEKTVWEDVMDFDKKQVNE